jgi:hypothetical protein
VIKRQITITLNLQGIFSKELLMISPNSKRLTPVAFTRRRGNFCTPSSTSTVNSTDALLETAPFVVFE